MKMQSTLSYIILIFGVILLLSGVGRLSGFLEYDSFISSKSVAIRFIIIGLVVMFISFYINRRKDDWLVDFFRRKRWPNIRIVVEF